MFGPSFTLQLVPVNYLSIQPKKNRVFLGWMER